MIELFPEDAPNTVNNFLKLVESDYYDGIDFSSNNSLDLSFKQVIQTPRILGLIEVYGDTGGPGYSISEEFNNLQHDRGMVSMARSQSM